MKAGVILKTIERCNINCTYCYYFNKADQSWRNRKPHISMEMIDKFNDLISQGEHVSLINLSNITSAILVGLSSYQINFNNFLSDMENRPDDCKQCCYENICGGGSYGNRFNPANVSFNNPSVYCEGFLAKDYTISFNAWIF